MQEERKEYSEAQRTEFYSRPGLIRPPTPKEIQELTDRMLGAQYKEILYKPAREISDTSTFNSHMI